MSTFFSCSQCGFSREVNNSLIGRKAKCPKCNSISIIEQNTEIATTKPSAKSSTVSSTESSTVLQSTSTQTTKKIDNTPTPTIATATTNTTPNPKKSSAKLPNPLLPHDGNIALCPTLQSQDELNRYRALL
ncbi:MAG: hypothetical protein LBH59_05150, partial [Planctomycetaceae bacterium]|nr:hypothetical protein [Planctomycetaceae bacterium]